MKPELLTDAELAFNRLRHIDPDAAAIIAALGRRVWGDLAHRPPTAVRAAWRDSPLRGMDRWT